MKGNRIWWLATTALTVLLLASTTAWASLRFEELCVDLPGVESDGDLSEQDFDETDFFALVNTRTGKFIGKAEGSVDNDSGRPALFVGHNFFCDYYTTVCASIYLVSGDDAAHSVYLAIGRLTN